MVADVRSGERRERWIAVAALGLALVVLLALGLRLSALRSYAIDEFAYAHGAWMIAQGKIPAVDFFETKFLLPLWIFSSVFVVGGDDPHLIAVLRTLMWPFLAISLGSAAWLNRRSGPLAIAATALCMAASPLFMNSALEIRPDAVALAFLLLGLAAIGDEHEGVGRAFGVGVVFGLCLWSTAKSVIYASPIAAIWLHDAIRRDRALLFRHRWATAAGGALVLAGVGIYLWWTDSMSAFYANAIAHNRKFLAGPRLRPWQPDVLMLLQTVPWLHALALVGIARTLMRLRTSASAEGERARGGDLGHGRDLVLLLLLLSTAASYGLQSYPFHYSLLPFMAIEAIFAARGFAGLLVWAWPGLSVDSAPASAPSAGTRLGLRSAAVVASLATLFGTLQAARIYASASLHSNQPQHELLDLIAHITSPGEPVYDNSGSYVARPNAYFLPWTDEPIRRQWADKLNAEVPASIEDSDCVVVVIDERFQGLPPELRAYIQAHFKPVHERLALWAQDFESGGATWHGTFHANRAGHYRIMPAEAIESGTLVIGESRITDTVFALDEGTYDVRLEGAAAGTRFRLQWAPQLSRPADAG